MIREEFSWKTFNDRTAEIGSLPNVVTGELDNGKNTAIIK